MSTASRPWLVIAGITGALSVALAAMAAHAAGPEGAARMATAVRYLMWHSLALLAVAWLVTGPAAKWARRAGRLFVAGQVLFYGALLLSTVNGLEGIALAALAGGLSFIAGWLCLAMAGLSRRA
ncbi:MAG: DUF423 domain-containing protein [Alphaproteobacteria bacterium]|jgi:uncharacterized membrane protein YgdD (TMEM256/DUF423 family)|nr:DUF423 domain-containing protein [Rhodospirillaceae bacterium]MBT6202120.1 DUF423 domain-containing protein [Rhodospirillaceae bacterium]MBT6510882.1 DUF423 domain-containing protein [Rhodospirillaceae bacterium]MBT7613182.1 DUF423 domain-containing protein [Rhodospirillaceae bacterium]MDG2481935.1 DUF423 domain-containing protein [Alphaproteobacteria bacterium]